MAKKLNIADYTKYFVPTEDGVLIDSEIFQHRKELGDKFWDLLDLMSGFGDEKSIDRFESTPDDAYLLRKQFDAMRNKLFEIVSQRDGEFCCVCKTNVDLTLDHVTPLSKGGLNDISNMKILCRSHNSKKGARLT